MVARSLTHNPMVWFEMFETFVNWNKFDIMFCYR